MVSDSTANTYHRNLLLIASQAEPETIIDISVGGTSYMIDTAKLPYFRSYLSFQTAAGQELVHKDIAYFDAIFAGIDKGYRLFLRQIPPTLEAHYELWQSLEYLCIDVLGGITLDNIGRDLKAGATMYEDEGRRGYITRRGNRELARDSAYLLVYKMLAGEFGNEVKDAVKVYNLVLYVVSHPSVFRANTRIMVRAAFGERFSASSKQISNLDKWPVLGKSGWEETQDLTTEEEISDFSWDDSCYDS